MELLSREHLRSVISEAQLDLGLAATEDDIIHLLYIHLGPESELAKVRRALGVLVDGKDDN